MCGALQADRGDTGNHPKVPADIMQHGDQGSCQDAFLQPQVSHSSPIKTRDRGSHDHNPHVAAASADLADLVRDYNALSARCQASEQQLARTRRELCKERQRSRHLRASCDALTMNHMQLGRELQQQRASIAGSILPPGHQDGLSALAGSGQRGSYSSSNSSSQEHMLPPMCPRPMQHDGYIPGGWSPARSAQQAGAAASRYHRYSTDTEVADQSRDGGSTVPLVQTQGSNHYSHQPVEAAAAPTFASSSAAAVKFTDARLDRSWQSLGGAAAADTNMSGPALMHPAGAAKVCQFDMLGMLTQTPPTNLQTQHTSLGCLMPCIKCVASMPVRPAKPTLRSFCAL